MGALVCRNRKDRAERPHKQIVSYVLVIGVEKMCVGEQEAGKWDQQCCDITGDQGVDSTTSSMFKLSFEYTCKADTSHRTFQAEGTVNPQGLY